MDCTQYNTTEEALLNMQSFEAIKYILKDIELHDLQCVDVMKMLFAKKCMLIYDTGLGKTLLASAFIKLLCNEDPSRKFLIFVKKDQLIQTPDKITSACGKTIITSTAEASRLRSIIDRGLDTANILMLTHGCLSNEKIMSELFNYKDSFCGIIIDEAHELNNFNRTDSGGMLEAVCGSFEYCIALTATPITTSITQLAKLAHIISKERYADYKMLERKLKNGSFDITDDRLFFISRNREEFNSECNYNGIIEFVQPTANQKAECGGAQLMKLCKGEGAVNQANKLVSVIKQRQGQHGLVYINQHDIRNWVLPFLDAGGIRYECINGSTKSDKRSEIMSTFNSSDALDIVITSVTTAIDLDCDYVVFYEFTPLIKQMIGRAHRGLGAKNLDIIFILTEDSNELDYFAENILSRSYFARDILHKNYNEMEDAERQLKEYADTK